jgi:uncharacterized damage-inducible protein DinB
MWNDIGNKLVAIAQDFPEDKYDFKLQKDQRTFAENLLHVAAVDYDLMRSLSGSNPDPTTIVRTIWYPRTRGDSLGPSPIVASVSRRL